MIDFIIKSTASLFVLLAVYHLALENEKMHHFNRFYLLFAIIFSFTIPFITIEVIQEITTPVTSKNAITMEGATMTSVEDSTNYWIIAIWSIYGVITSVLLFRFIRNILKLNAKSKSATEINFKNANLVLIKEKTLPYTFMNSIFINETDYNNRKIEAELYTHELIHVNQKHTLDILLLETLKAVFWFNPIFIFYKKAIQLNHEFLADEKVVQSHNNVPFYQNLLITKANANPTYYLASNLNYSVTKKRLIMMTTTTSVARATLKKGLLIPVLTAIVFSICTKTIAQEINKKQTATSEKSNGIFNKYYEKTTFKIKDKNGNIVTEKKYNDLTPIEAKALPSIISNKKGLPTTEELSAELKKGASEVIEIDVFSPENQKVKKAEGEIYKISELSENPSYPEGMGEFYKFVAQNFKISKEMSDDKVKGRVYITFTIENDGSISDVRSLRDVGYGTGEEAIRVMKLSPKWSPGKVNGEAVKVMYSLPITINTEQ